MSHHHVNGQSEPSGDFTWSAGQVLALRVALGVSEGRDEGDLRGLIGSTLDIDPQSPAATAVLVSGSYISGFCAAIAARTGSPAAGMIIGYLEIAQATADGT